MKPDPNYPRMMFHRSKDPVTVYSEEQENALGPQWSRKIVAALAREEKPLRLPDPDPEEQPEEEEPEWGEPEEEPAETVEAAAAPPPKPKRVHPPAHKPVHPAAHKRKR